MPVRDRIELVLRDERVNVHNIIVATLYKLPGCRLGGIRLSVIIDWAAFAGSGLKLDALKSHWTKFSALRNAILDLVQDALQQPLRGKRG